MTTICQLPTLLRELLTIESFRRDAMSRQNTSLSTSFSHDYSQNLHQQKATSYSKTLSFLRGNQESNEKSIQPQSSLPLTDISDITE